MLITFYFHLFLITKIKLITSLHKMINLTNRKSKLCSNLLQTIWTMYRANSISLFLHPMWFKILIAFLPISKQRCNYLANIKTAPWFLIKYWNQSFIWFRLASLAYWPWHVLGTRGRLVNCATKMSLTPLFYFFIFLLLAFLFS